MTCRHDGHVSNVVFLCILLCGIQPEDATNLMARQGQNAMTSNKRFEDTNTGVTIGNEGRGQGLRGNVNQPSLSINVCLLRFCSV